jgi:hypothetical protein
MQRSARRNTLIKLNLKLIKWNFKRRVLGLRVGMGRRAHGVAPGEPQGPRRGRAEGRVDDREGRTREGAARATCRRGGRTGRQTGSCAGATRATREGAARAARLRGRGRMGAVDKGGGRGAARAARRRAGAGVPRAKGREKGREGERRGKGKLTLGSNDRR